MDLRLAIGVTGHRDLVASEVPALKQHLREWFDGLKRQFPGLELELISGLAEGADRLAAEVALEAGATLVAVLPFAAAEYERDFPEASSREQFRSLLGRSETVVLPLLEDVTLEEIAGSAEMRNRQYAQLGVFVANHCDILLALWDGQATRSLGGTAAVVHYYHSGTMPGFIELPDSPSLLADNESDLAYHLVCSRAKAGTASMPGMAPLESAWLTSRGGRSPGSSMPPEYALMFSRLADFKSDLARHGDEVAAQGLLTELPELALPSGIEVADRLYRDADAMAIHFQQRFGMGLYLNYLLASLMGLVFIFYSEFTEHSLLAWLFLGLFGLGVLFHRIGDRHQWHRKYLDYRALAEGLRVQVYWALAGVVDSRSAEFAYDNFLQKQDVDLAWIRHVMRAASLRRRRGEEPDPAWVDWVVNQWVGTHGGQRGQLGYYEARALSKSKTYRRTTRLSRMTLWLGVAITIMLALTYMRMQPMLQHLFMVLMGILPLMAGIRDAYSHKKAEKELIKQYRFMAGVFTKARKLLDTATGLAERRAILRAVGNAALDEHAEWLLMHRERPLEHGKF